MLKNKFLQTSKITLLSGLCILTVCQQALNAGGNSTYTFPEPKDLGPWKVQAPMENPGTSQWETFANAGFQGPNKQEYIYATFFGTPLGKRPSPLTPDQIIFEGVHHITVELDEIRRPTKGYYLAVNIDFNCTTQNRDYKHGGQCSSRFAITDGVTKDTRWNISNNSRTVTWWNED